MTSTGKKKSKNGNLIVCEWCGAMIVQKYPNQKYCDINDKPCRYYAELERNNKYRKKTHKPLLGSSNIGEHANEDFEKEKQIIQKEKRRYRL